MKELLTYLEDHSGEMLDDLEHLVRLESPSHDRDRINRAQELVAGWFTPAGELDRIPSDLGDVLHVRAAGAGDGRVLLLAHVDTVYPAGSWGKIWQVEGVRALGPGVYDMKGGIIQAAWGLKALRSLGLQLTRSVELLITPDEEIGSEAGRRHIEERARGAARGIGSGAAIHERRPQNRP